MSAIDPELDHLSDEFKAQWKDLCDDTENDPSILDILDFIASYSEGWPAEMASVAYIREIREMAEGL